MFPDVADIYTGRPAIAVAVNAIGLPISEPEVAVIAYVPAFVPSVNLVEARPRAFVVTSVSLKRAPSAPTGVPEIANLTAAPEIGVPY